MKNYDVHHTQNLSVSTSIKFTTCTKTWTWFLQVQKLVYFQPPIDHLCQRHLKENALGARERPNCGRTGVKTGDRFKVPCVTFGVWTLREGGSFLTFDDAPRVQTTSHPLPSGFHHDVAADDGKWNAFLIVKNNYKDFNVRWFWFWNKKGWETWPSWKQSLTNYYKHASQYYCPHNISSFLSPSSLHIFEILLQRPASQQDLDAQKRRRS